MKKTCSSCKKTKQASGFGKNRSRKDGLAGWCRVCEQIRYKKREHTLSRRYSIYKSSSKKKKRRFDISIDEFSDITSSPCVYCGGFSDVDYYEDFCGIDRVDPTKGYINGKKTRTIQIRA